MSMSNVINLNSFFILNSFFLRIYNGDSIYLYLKYDEQKIKPTQFNLFSLKTLKLERE